MYTQMDNLYWQSLDTPIGEILVAGSARGICRVSFSPELSGDWLDWFDRHCSSRPKTGFQPLLKRAARQLSAYFLLRRKVFDLPLDLRGTPFQVRIWKNLAKVPYGSTVSYGGLARQVEKPGAAQAVGAAMGKNPLPIIIPCHRVIGSDGSLVGFGGGLGTKARLLRLEGVQVPPLAL